MTPERFHRLQDILRRRQPDLTVLLDNVHKTHNLSAIVRSCDAVGILKVHSVWPREKLRPNHLTSGGSGKWVPIVTHPKVESAIHGLRNDGFTILAAHLGPGAVDFREVDYTRPCALVLGAELLGVSETALKLADQHVYVPLKGMVGSLNVSVAAAVILFEAERQRRLAGLYDESRLETERFEHLLFEWAWPKIASYCRRHGTPYPALNEAGDIVGTNWRA